MASIKSFLPVTVLILAAIISCGGKAQETRRLEDPTTFIGHEHSHGGRSSNGHNGHLNGNKGHSNGHNGHGNGHNGHSNTIMPISRCRHNYHERTEQAINRQINLFMHAGYVYSSMAQHFGRCDVALPGFTKFFHQLAKDQREKSESLMTYQNLRGGTVHLSPVTAPALSDWGSGLEAMSQALEMEKSVNQVDKIFTLSQYISNLERVGPGLGEYLFDKLPQN
ncbi:soma ferritin isoform X2 [Hyalella azteca]|uniref:Ferritin n=1 Tax=Hyalella azteca TaxID=294128 RepID=A0A8B7PK21_HYAAZ|nr:soma ferritin isoform X2 [Hyalella azteca]